ncbi:MAG: TlpA family protein disulfide reductase [Armatimonadetes bacterium]|nr:TlpA family protein disulfide reductase [Armatimonadota bacterium]
MRCTKTIIAALLIAAVVITTGCGKRERNPTPEHPSFSMRVSPVSQQAQHPGASQESHPAPEAQAKPREVQAMFSGIVEEYVDEVSKKNDGAFVIHDEILGKDWRQKLVRIHRDKIVSLGESRYFACADFEELKGGGKLDLDFYVGGAPDWKVAEALIHKVNGTPRYTYNENNERVPVKSGKAGETSDRDGEVLKVGDEAPDFSLRDLSAKEIKLSAYKGGVVLLWFTNLCPGCQGVLPGVVKAHKNYAKKGVTFLAVSLLGDDKETVLSVVRKHKVTFPFLIDPKVEVYPRYGGVKVPPGTCPTNPQLFILDKGKVAYATHFPGAPEAELWKTIDKLIRPSEGKSPQEHPQ